MWEGAPGLIGTPQLPYHCNTLTFDPVNPVYTNDRKMGSEYSQIKEV